MPACPTRWWRCATAPWASISRASPATAARTSARRRVSGESLAWAKDAAAQVAQRYGIERIDARHARALARGRDPHALSLRRARPAGIPRRPCRRRDLGARRATGAGDRPICRHARRAHRAGRRRRGARGDDRVVAQADGLEGRVRAGRDGHRNRHAGRADHRSTHRRRRHASTANELAALLERNAATVIDLSLSPNYRKGHIPGAWFAIRSRLARALPKIPLRGELVLTSEDGVLAGLAVPEAAALTRPSGPLPQRRQRGVAGRRSSALDRAAHGRRRRRRLAQAL